MQLHQKTNATLFVVCLSTILLMLSSGCRTGGFSAPDMNKLAFWKSENLMFASKKDNRPPPPARHFDPAPITGEGESQVVDLNPRQLKRRFDNDIDEMRAEISAAAKAATPDRKTADKNTSQEVNQFVADAGSEFRGATDRVRGKLEQFESKTNSGLTAAQSEFQMAMQNTTQAFDQGLAATTKAATEYTQRTKDNAFPLGQTSTKSKGSLADVNRSLSAATEKLNTSLHPDGDNAFKTGISAFGGALKPIGNSAVDQANQMSENAKQSVSEMAGKANGFLDSVEPGKQVAAQSQQQQAELAEARRQIEKLKQQLATGALASETTVSPPQALLPPKPGTANSFAASPTQSTPVDPPADANSNAFNSRYAFNPSASPTPSNHLRNEASQPNFPPSGQGFSKPNYPSTAHNGFEPQPKPFGGMSAPAPLAFPTSPSDSATVDFQSGDKSSNVVTANNAISPMASDSASQIQSEVSDIDLPEAILRGSGGYAPGSIQPLKPIR